MPRQLGEAFRTEWRVTNRVFWPFGLLGLAAVGLFTLLTTPLSTPALTAWSYQTNWTQFLALALMLAAAWVAGREAMAGQSEITRAWPTSGGSYLGARYLGVLIPSLFYLAVLETALWIWEAVVLGAAPNALPFLMGWLSGLITVGFGLALAILAGTLIRRNYLVYPALVLYWAATTALVPVALSNGGYPGTGVLDFSLAARPWTYSPVSGLGPSALALILNRALYLALTGAVMTGTVLAWNRRRGQGAGAVALIAVLVVCLGFSVAAGAFIVSGDIAAQRSHAAYVAGQSFDRGFIKDAGPTAPGFSIDSYDLAVELDPAAHVMSVKAGLELIPAPGRDTLPGEIRLTLRHNFAVTRVGLAPSPGSTVTGARDLPFSRNGSYLAVKLPAGTASGTIALEYSGKVEEWLRNGFVRTLSLGPVLLPDLIWLPAGYAWYPAPGWQDLSFGPIIAGRDQYYEDRPAQYDPASYRVILTGLGGLEPVAAGGLEPVAARGLEPVAARGLEAGSLPTSVELAGRTTSLSLLAAHYRRFTSGAYALYLSPAIGQEQADRIAAAVASRLSPLAKYLPPAPHGMTVVEWPAHLSGGGHSPGWALPGVVRIGDDLTGQLTLDRGADPLSTLSEWSAHALDLELFALHIRGLLSAGSVSSPSANLAVQEYLTALTVLETSGRPAYDRLLAERKALAGDAVGVVAHRPGIYSWGRSIEPYVQALDAIYRAGGAGSVVTVLSAAAARATPVGISNSVLSAAIRDEAARLGAAAEVEALLAELPQMMEEP